MRAGSLDRVITIQRFTSTVDDYGGVVETWADVATIRAQLVQASTDEYIAAGLGAQDKAVMIFRIRWMDGITNADRVSYNGGFFNLKEIKEIGRREGLELRCEALS
jgi:SPP1 family predicted phage head-tail adaptor